ncbi:MAG: acyl-CoA thioesterase [Christensenellaceae bacterium]|nr:acyl-CoA thioesterase [Christensenellaceae bacterium]
MVNTKLTVRYTETGAEGFAYHGNYYGWFDIVQSQFLEENGLSYKRITDAGVHFLPIDVKSRYYAPAYFGDELTVEMKVVALSNVKTTLSYEVTRGKDKALIARSTITYACMDQNFRPLVFKKVLPRLYAALEEHKVEA